MARLNLDAERVLPCLLERLTDHYPRATKESREHRTVSLRKYRDSVLRDLEWLLNCEAHPRPEEFEGMERVQRSVVNYGIRSLTGAWRSSHDSAEIEALFRDAIIRFEPRIIPETLDVRLLNEEETDSSMPGGVFLEIIADLWAQPMPEQLHIRTELDLETGTCTLQAR